MAVTTVTGIRLLGGTVTSAPLICPIIAIISAYSFLQSLESRGRAFFLFLVGLGATLATRARGSEIALFICLSLVVMAWARTNQRSASAVISGAMAFMALVGLAGGAIGGERIWNIFNKGQNVAGIKSASGRTEIWAFVIKYCLAHPQGMGYVAGFRIVFRQYFSLTSGQTLSQLGTAHNTFVDVLAGAGWLALGIYLIMMVKIVKLAWRFAKRQRRLAPVLDRSSLHGIRCSLVLLVFCFTYGMGAAELSAPLRAGFYILYIIIAIVLGASANMLVAYRVNNSSPPRDISGRRGIELASGL
jgi:O-antigen ligase